MGSTTVTGANHETITLNFKSAENTALAQQLASRIDNAVAAGTVVPVDYTGTTPPPVTPGQPAEVVVKANGPVTLPPEATNVVVDAPNSVVTGGGAPNEQVLGGDGNLQFFTNGGSGTVVTGDGNNLIVQDGPGGWNLHTGEGDDTVSVSSGPNTIAAGGGSNDIRILGGTNSVYSTGTDAILVAAGSTTINAAGAPHYDVVEGVNANITFIGGGGVATVNGAEGSVTVIASAGGEFHGGTAGNNLIEGGTGATTIFGGGDGDRLFAGAYAQTDIFAAGGNETLAGSHFAGPTTFHAGSGQDLIVGGMGNDTFFASSGAATMAGGVGHDVFDFIKGQGGTVTIQDFTPDDKVTLTGYGSHEVDQALHTAHTAGGSTTITLSDQTQITFSGVGHLDKSNFG